MMKSKDSMAAANLMRKWLKYIMGHTHCNKVTATDPRGGPNSALGMMVAGQGMEGCGNLECRLLTPRR